ncbi:hypothetical protein KP509_26G006500 [Ceratopteris richardii]|uniref:Uncharacterized protein n=1 Tax=Ceratopteris richardii TaxID=49495 RepID=A0A8T2RJP5_CERRI|nr:hypothetical protein KP509_26G006500 [Ceratopteris richardii]
MANVLRAMPSLTFHPYRASRTCLLVSPRASFPRLSQMKSACMLTVPICETMRVISRTLSQAQELAQKIVSSFQQVSSPPTLDKQALISVLRSRLSIVGTIACFAAISSSSVNTPSIMLYSGILMLRVLLSWFPNIPWERQPLQAIRDMCDPNLNLFRNIIPPLFNALDVSPLFAFLILGILTSTLNTSVQV